ncbi:MAG: hypothetical protein O2946_01875 [Planctomycetota bacterium]|nr:hypothetical protein [Planctomycetota bacterium]
MKAQAAAGRRRIVFAVFISCVTVAGPISEAASVLQSYTSESAFTEALGDSFTSTTAMASLSLGPVTGPLSFSGAGFGFSVDSTAAGADNLYVTDALTGSGIRYLTPGLAADSLVLSSILPSGGVTALGGVFFATDIVEQFVSSEIELLFTFADSQTVSHAFTPSSLASGTYYGIIADTPISSVRVASASPTLFATFGSGTVGVPATVGDLYWTADGTTAGGTGTWGGGNQNWSATATPAAVRAWNAESRGIFAGTPGTVTIDPAGVSANAGLVFETDITVSGGALTLGGATATENLITTSTGVTATIAAPRGGTTDVAIAGPGALVLAAGSTATGDTTVTSGTLRLAHAEGLAVSATTVSGGRLDITVDAAMPTLSVEQGSVVLDSTTRRLLTLDSLAVAETGLIDVGKGRIDIGAGGIAAADLRADIIAGRDGGSWTGTSGITSSVAATQASFGVGYVVAPSGAASVAWAALGDSTLDGLVDFNDILAMFPNYDGTGPFNWQQGDFNYDGLVNFDDIIAMFPNYGAANYLTGGASGMAAAGSGLSGGAAAAVPEPGSLTLAAFGCLLLGLWQARNRVRR